jgi:hypothetical protein
MPKTPHILIVAFLLTVCAWSEVQYRRVGATLASSDAALSCWLVEGEPTLGRGIVVKISGVGKEGECNVLLSREQLKELKTLCKKAMSYREPMRDGQITILGTLNSYENRLEVAVLRTAGLTVRVLVAHEKDKREQGFQIESVQEGSLYRLLDESLALLR